MIHQTNVQKIKMIILFIMCLIGGKDKIMGKTFIKFIKEIDSIITNENLEEDEKELNQTIYQCISCNWRFVGDCIRYGQGYSEGVQTPNYCPMCGKEIKALI